MQDRTRFDIVPPKKDAGKCQESKIQASLRTMRNCQVVHPVFLIKTRALAGHQVHSACKCQKPATAQDARDAQA